MAKLEAKFGLGDFVHLALQASYSRDPALYEVYRVEFTQQGLTYSIRLVDSPRNFIHVTEDKLVAFKK
jgi:hypothetical protein